MKPGSIFALAVAIIVAAAHSASSAQSRSGTGAGAARTISVPRPSSRYVEEQRARALAAEIAARVQAGTATPEAEAAAAAARGEFGLMATQMMPYRRREAPGLACFTPRHTPPRIGALYVHGDAIERADARWMDYAYAYNRALAARDDYPDADLCRLAAAGDARFSWDEQPATMAARTVTRPPRSLHEAARRGSAVEVTRLLQTVAVDTPDGLNMTPLAWAVARNNGPAFETLLAAGANPWLGGETGELSPVFLAAALGRSEWFARLAARPGRPFEAWPAWHQMAAFAGGDPNVVAAMLAAPHARLQIELLRRPFPSPTLLEPLLREDPSRANTLLLRAVEMEVRPDLVRLALTHGANPNAGGPYAGSETALGRAAKGIYPGSVEAVDLLLAAGADPNLISSRRRPLWHAVGILKQGNGFAEIDARATANFNRLRAAGADINMPDADGVPPIRALLFPYSWDHRRLGASGVTPELLEMLVRAGLDLNARWHGERVLGPVEAQAGRNSELAVTLRRLGARR